MNLLSGIIIFAIGFIIVLIAILMIDKRDSLSTFLFIIAIGVMLIGIFNWSWYQSRECYRNTDGIGSK